MTLNTTIPAGIADETLLAAVSISGYFYAVDLGENFLAILSELDDARRLERKGEISHLRRNHRVGVDGYCTCALGKGCPAVEQVRIYLHDGGQRVKPPDIGFFPVAPRRCPVCSAPAFADPSVSSANRGAGWKCSVDKGHYWLHRGRIGTQRVLAFKAKEAEV